MIWFWLKLCLHGSRINIRSLIVLLCTFSDAQKSMGMEYYNHIRFTDNGIGFEEEYSKIIFSLFQRLHGKQDYAGTGIGLALCKKIAENHGGMITAEGIPGEGATFHIYLPAVGG
jgi:signal transduction histidine kinase